jgi:hypothetical protein
MVAAKFLDDEWVLEWLNQLCFNIHCSSKSLLVIWVHVFSQSSISIFRDCLAWNVIRS